MPRRRLGRWPFWLTSPWPSSSFSALLLLVSIWFRSCDILRMFTVSCCQYYLSYCWYDFFNFYKPDLFLLQSSWQFCEACGSSAAVAFGEVCSKQRHSVHPGHFESQPFCVSWWLLQSFPHLQPRWWTEPSLFQIFMEIFWMLIQLHFFACIRDAYPVAPRGEFPGSPEEGIHRFALLHLCGSLAFGWQSGHNCPWWHPSHGQCERFCHGHSKSH